MLLTKTVLLKRRGNNKLEHYIKLGYDVTGDEFLVNVDDLTKNSVTLVHVECDICNKRKFLSYSKYLKNVLNQNIYTCSRSCSNIKIKKTNLEKYGEEWACSSDLVKEKTKKTNLEKYGECYTFNVESINSKIKETNLEKYGVDNVFKSDIFKNKIKETNLEKYGVDNVFKSDIFKNKIKETNLEKYGVEYYVQTYGFNILVRDKINITNLERYGGHPMRNDEFRKKFNICNDLSYIGYISDGNSLFSCDKNHEFILSSDQYRGRKNNNTNLCSICYPISEHRSIKEIDFLTFIENNYNGEIISGYRDKMEIDIYLPELKIGLEFNGLYWHSDKYKDSGYHITKTKYFNDRGIRIIHIWEDDWDFKRDIVESQIKNLLNLNNIKIFARKCDVRKIKDINIIKKFLNENHIQGFVRSVEKFGLFFDNELVSIMTFDNFEGRKKMEEGGWNLSRFCNKLNTSVVGGASKLLNAFIKDKDSYRIISYADMDWSQGDLYYKLGFDKVNETRSDYKYIIDNKRVHKSNFKKSKLNTILSESDHMKINGILRIYDCGKIKFTKNKKGI